MENLSEGEKIIGKNNRALVAILTDYGLAEECVAVCKGVILKKCPDATFIDITHFIEPYNIRKAAFVLYSAVRWIKADVFLAIVDPGVGGKRRNIVVETNKGYFVGPDNGLLIPAIKNTRIHKIISAEKPEFYIRPVSATFHGRDIYSSLTAYILLNEDISNFGPELELESLTPAPWGEPKMINRKLCVEIIDSDNFGSLRTNFCPAESKILEKINIKPGKRIVVQYNSISTIVPVVKTYSDMGENNLGILFDSTGHLTIFANRASAKHKLRLRPGDKITLKII